MSKVFSSLLLFFLWVGVFSFEPLRAQPQKQKIKVSDMLNIRQVTQVAIQPGGGSAVYVLNSIEPDKEKKDEQLKFNDVKITPPES